MIRDFSMFVFEHQLSVLHKAQKPSSNLILTAFDPLQVKVIKISSLQELNIELSDQNYTVSTKSFFYRNIFVNVLSLTQWQIEFQALIQNI